MQRKRFDVTDAQMAAATTPNNMPEQRETDMVDTIQAQNEQPIKVMKWVYPEALEKPRDMMEVKQLMLGLRDEFVNAYAAMSSVEDSKHRTIVVRQEIVQRVQRFREFQGTHPHLFNMITTPDVDAETWKTVIELMAIRKQQVDEKWSKEDATGVISNYFNEHVYKIARNKNTQV